MITARALRSVLKEDLKVVAIKRNEQLLKVFKWKDGKQGDMVRSLVLLLGGFLMAFESS